MCTYPVTESSPGGRQTSVLELSWKERVLSGPSYFLPSVILGCQAALAALLRYVRVLLPLEAPGRPPAMHKHSANHWFTSPTWLLILIEGFDLVRSFVDVPASPLTMLHILKLQSDILTSFLIKALIETASPVCSRGWDSNKNWFSLFVCVLPGDKSALMFEYLTEWGNVNIFYQTFRVGLHAARVSKAHCCLNEWLLTDLWCRENHMLFEALLHEQMWSSLMAASELILMSLSIKRSDSLQINP